MIFWKTQNYRDDQEQIGDCLRLRVGFDYKRGNMRKFGKRGDGPVLYLIVVVVIQL